MSTSLSDQIMDWNDSRVDMFAMSIPDQNSEYFGVMRFYYKERWSRAVTKCMRVSSTASTVAVIEALVDKLHPDMRMLTTPVYQLLEVLENGEERRLGDTERPLEVQLAWVTMNRDGRFQLRDNQHMYEPLGALDAATRNTKRRLSKRERKVEKARQRQVSGGHLQQRRMSETENSSNFNAKSIYDEVPATTFTRTISNPEIVMKKRREQQVNRLNQMHEGGSLKIFGGQIDSRRPYVTLLVSSNDHVQRIMQEALDKYAVPRSVHTQYSLVELDREQRPRVLSSHEHPLALLQGDLSLTFHLRVGGHSDVETRSQPVPMPNQQARGQLPILVPCYNDGTADPSSPMLSIAYGATLMGSEAKVGHPCLVVHSSRVHKHHCTLTFTDGCVTVTPAAPQDIWLELQTFCAVNGHRIEQTTILHDKCTLTVADLLFTLAHSADAQHSPFLPHAGQSNDEQMSRQHQHVVKQLSATHSSTSAMSQRLSHDMSERRPSIDPVPVLRQPSSTASLLGRDAIPAIVELHDTNEEQLLNALTEWAVTKECEFKLAPAFVLYMCARYRVSPHYRTSLYRHERAEHLEQFIKKAARHITQHVQRTSHDTAEQCRWLGNCSELAQLVRNDVDMATAVDQDTLAIAVHTTFEHLSVGLKHELHASLSRMLHEGDDAAAVHSTLTVLQNTTTLLHSNQLNAALTIQLASHLFHYVNMYMFNWLVSLEGGSYCSRRWAHRLRTRLQHILEWSLKAGLEQTAEIHLAQLSQAIALLIADKSMENVSTIVAECYRLNSVQMRHLLRQYECEANEVKPTPQFINCVSELAAAQVDSILTANNEPIELETERDYNQSFIVPSDGYLCESLIGLPSPLRAFAERLVNNNICRRLLLQPQSSGKWTVYFQTREFNNNDVHVKNHHTSSTSLRAMDRHTSGEPSIGNVVLERGGGGIGLSIVAAMAENESEHGIYVKKIVPGSVAANDGRLRPGDQLLSVNGISLLNIMQEEAARRLAASGAVLSLQVAERAAFYNGLASHIIPQSDGDAPSTDRSTHQHQISKSVTSLHHTSQGQLQTSLHRGATANASNGHLQHSSDQPKQASPKAMNVPIQTLTYTGDDNLLRQSESQASELSVRTPSHSQHQQQMTHQQLHQQPLHQVRQTQQQHQQQHNQQMPVHVMHEQPSGLLKTASMDRSPAPVSRTSSSSHVPPASVGHSKTYSHSSRQSSERDSVDRRRQHGAPSDISTPSPVSITTTTTTRRESVVSEELRRLPHHTSASDINGRGLPSPSILRRDQENAAVDDDVLLMAMETVRELETRQTPLTPVEQRRFGACKKIVEYARVLEDENNSTTNQSVSVTPTPVLAPAKQTSISDLAQQMQSTQLDAHAVQSNGGVRVNGHTPSYRTPDAVVLSVDNYQREPSSGSFHPQQTSPPQLTSQYHRDPSANVHQPAPVSPGSYTQTIPIHEPVAIPRKQPPPPPPKRSRATSQGAVIAQSVADLPTSAPLAAVEAYEVPQTTTTVETNGRYVYGENDARVQVLGGQEVYKGDPRQRRINSMQQQQQQKSHNSVDGSNLPFREKMKLFAAQLGEGTPKGKVTASSAQRGIELAES